MGGTIEELIRAYRFKGAIVDANLLLLFFVGAFDSRLIAAFERTRNYTAEDHEILTLLLAEFDTLVTTPNILTEVSNLAGKLHRDAKAGFFDLYAQGVATLDECYVPSIGIVRHSTSIRPVAPTWASWNWPVRNISS